MDFNKITKKWQKAWQEKEIFKVKEDDKKKKFYCLEMFPYPSGSGLHMGHARNYIISDVLARFKRMQGFNVLYPVGYDSFGLPAENAAIISGIHPKIHTEESIKNFINQQKELGLSYDWSRFLATHTPDYYRWNQWLFIQLFKKGLAYKKKSSVNFCKQCNTVLANEQVVKGRCWRHAETEVETKELEQWFFKITKYSDRLLRDISKLEGWPEDVKAMQKNWIGKSEGVDIFFKLEGTEKILPTFTTRWDTIYSVTFLAVAPENPLIKELVKGTRYENGANEFIEKVKREALIDRINEEKEKEGFFIGKYTINPVSNEKIPIYIANFALMYGSGIVMCDAHDKRDFKFAKKYKIPLKFVISRGGKEVDANKAREAYTNDGVLFNSGKFSGMKNKEALPQMATWLQKEGLGKKRVNYKIHDWLISRQRYWGTPIPIIYCEKCGVVLTPEKDLPVLLPDKIDFKVKGNPLASVKDFVNTRCPNCGDKAKRETDTMDTFVDSSWYFMRYCDPQNSKKIFESKKVNYWVPVDCYIGGKEHATMHLLYFRFFTKIFKDLGLVNFDEPTTRLFNQGMLHKEGFVMSKSRGNIVTPGEISSKYGIDTARLYLMFVASPEKDMEWGDKGIEGTFRFVNKVIKLFSNKIVPSNANLDSKRNKVIKEVTEDIENFRYNLAIIKLMEYVKSLSNGASRECLETLLKLLAPFTPHIAEELWSSLGNKGFISLEKWPAYNPEKIDDKLEFIEGLIKGTEADVFRIKEIAKIDRLSTVKIFVASNWKFNLFKSIKKEVSNYRDIGKIIKSVMIKGYEREIPKIVQQLVKDPNKMPRIILSQKQEIGIFTEAKNTLEKEFSCEVEIIKEDKSKEPKAKQALPGKPAILVE